MSADLSTAKQGRVGRITFTRPQALNALSHEMAMKIEQALDAWATDDDVAMIVIDAEGERAFCAGGDIAAMYHAGKAGDYQIARDFWADEYRMNAKMYNFPKPVAAFMQGFVMGGGVGVGGHASHRIVGDTSQVAMPESGIGLIPDVGGTLLLARAPGRIGEYLGVTGARMGPGDAIYAGFADYYIPEGDWPDLIAQLVDTGDWTLIDAAARPAPDAPLADLHPQIDAHFGGETIGDIVRSLRHEDTDFTASALKPINRNSPLSMACTVELIHRTRIRDTIEAALANEYRFTYRALELGDFIEGVRAQIIDKDRTPTWQDADAETLPATKISRMLMPLGADELTL
jgi:enoyl-CoA hydratase